MSEISLDSKYAPGLMTYGVKGDKGEDGANGVSIFFIPLYINNNISQIASYIKGNRIIGLDAEVEYTYNVGDTFVQPDGAVYQLNNLEDDIKVTSFTNIGKFIFSNSGFDLDENSNKIYNKSGADVIITDTDEEIADDLCDSLFNVILKNTSNDVKNNLIKIQNKDTSISISKEDKYFFLNGDLIIDNNILLKQNDTSKQIVDIDGKKYVSATSIKIEDIDSSNINLTYSDNKYKLSNLPVGEDKDYIYEFVWIQNDNIENKLLLTKNPTATEIEFDLPISEVYIKEDGFHLIIYSNKTYYSKIKTFTKTDDVFKNN